MAGNQTRYAAYLRVSQFDRRGASGDAPSIAIQHDACRRWVSERGGHLVTRYVDEDRSASRIDVVREAFEQLLGDLADPARGFDAVVFYRQDRLVRDPGDWGRWWRAHALSAVDFYGVRDGIDSTSPHGVVLSAVAVGIGKSEVNVMSQRIRDGKAAAAQAGRACGGPRPFGYQRARDPDTGRKTLLDPDPDEASVVREVFARFVAGEGLLAIAADLRGRGVRGTLGSPLGHSTVRAILRNPVYAGLRRHGGTTERPKILEGVVGQWPALVDRAVWERAQTLLDVRVTDRRGRHPRTYLLTGLMFCSVCGSALRARPVADGRRYGCPRPPHGDGCGHLYVAAEGAEAVVAAQVLAEVSDPAALVAMRAAASSGPERALVDELGLLERQRAERFNLYEAGVITAGELASSRRRLDDRVAAIREQLRAAGGAAALSDLVADATVLVARWESWTFPQRRALVEACVERVELLPATRRGGSGVDAGRLRVLFRA